MSIYIIEGDYDYGAAIYSDEGIFEQFQDLIFNRKIFEWKIPHLKLDLYRKKLWGLPTDCIYPLFGAYGLLLSLPAKELLKPLFEGCGEFYPVRVEGVDYTWFNVTKVVDNALNDELTVGERWKHEGGEGWFHINKYCFNEQKMMNCPNLFRIGGSVDSHVYCNQKTADFIMNSDLIGFDIKKIWRSSDAQHLFCEKCDGEPAVEFHRPTTFRWTKEEAKAVKLKRQDMIKKLQELGRLTI